MAVSRNPLADPFGGTRSRVGNGVFGPGRGLLGKLTRYQLSYTRGVKNPQFKRVLEGQIVAHGHLFQGGRFRIPNGHPGGRRHDHERPPRPEVEAGWWVAMEPRMSQAQ